MRLNDNQITHIDTKIDLDDDRSIIGINVTEKDGVKWSENESNFNIYCINKNYDIIWQVKETQSHPVSLFGETDPFYYLGQDSEGNIIADRFSGFEYKINSETGEATRTGFHK